MKTQDREIYAGGKGRVGKSRTGNTGPNIRGGKRRTRKRGTKFHRGGKWISINV